jgi:hypothetical protein
MFAVDIFIASFDFRAYKIKSLIFIFIKKVLSFLVSNGQNLDIFLT